jgi:phage baseplate assembly protein W
MDTQRGYTGIAFPFRFSSGGGVSTSTTSEEDFSHIHENIMQAILTFQGEDQYDPNRGSKLNTIVFRNNDVTTLALIQSYVKQALIPMSDRIDVKSVKYSIEDVDDSIVYIDIVVLVKKYLKTTSVRVIYRQEGSGI